MKKIYLILLYVIFINSVLAIEFNTTVIDSSVVYSNPSLSINQNTGVRYQVWSKETSLVYATSLDNFQYVYILSNDTRQLTQYSNIASVIDSNNILHIVFNAYNGQWKTYYINTNDMIIRDVNIGNSREQIDIAVDSNNKIYIIGQKEFTSNEGLDIFVISSIDYINFNIEKRISKVGHQLNPDIIIDNNNNIHLIYVDWSDGVSNGAGLYKIRYRNSIDNYTSEETPSSANQSYDGDIKADSLGNIWIVYKDTTETCLDDEFNCGIVWIADKNSNWNKRRISSNMIKYMQDRAVKLSISLNNVKHVSYIEREERNITVRYVNSQNLTNIQLAGVGYDQSIGYVDINTYQNIPYIAANINSLHNFNGIKYQKLRYALNCIRTILRECMINAL